MTGTRESNKPEKIAESGDKSGAAVSTKDNQKVKAEFNKKKQNFIVRTIWTLVMVAGMFSLLFLGPIWIIGLVLVLQVLTFKEVIALTSKPAREKELPLNRTLSWYFLLTSIYYLDGRTLIRHFQHLIFVDYYLSPLAANHKFISYCLYVLGFVFFVYTLKPNYYKLQFTQLAITHMLLVLVVFQAHLIINNILNGLFWFLLPVGLVIINDIFAYIVGITLGRTPLIAISPKKTVEGFLGAWVSTVIAGFALTHILSKSSYLICPVTDISVNIFNYPAACPETLNVSVFTATSYRLPPAIEQWIHMKYVTLQPIYLHAIVLATFASLIAPFGGFFASGVKRTFNIKDFGDTIPGHGGITDRMDCQFLMGSFAYLYYETFLSSHGVTVGYLLQVCVGHLQPAEIIQLIKALETYLFNSGFITKDSYDLLIDSL